MIIQAKKIIRSFIDRFIQTRKPFHIFVELIGFYGQWKKYSLVSAEAVSSGDWFPCLGDASTTTPFDPHYFYQSAWVASKLAHDRKKKHVDIGSQIDLIAPLSGFMKIEFVDIRPLQATIDNLTCTAGSILELPYRSKSLQSLSCLHVVEHIGLGRYGDEIDPQGTVKACKELQRVLARGGNLYLSVPIGRERVQFNAHRIFDPETILHIFNELKLLDFACVDDDGNYLDHWSSNRCRQFNYGLGMFHLSRG